MNDDVEVALITDGCANGVKALKPAVVTVTEYNVEKEVENVASAVVVLFTVAVADPHCKRRPLGNLVYPLAVKDEDPRVKLLVVTITPEVFTTNEFEDELPNPIP